MARFVNSIKSDAKVGAQHSALFLLNSGVIESAPGAFNWEIRSINSLGFTVCQKGSSLISVCGDRLDIELVF